MADFYSAEKGKSWWGDAPQAPATPAPSAVENIEQTANVSGARPTVVQPFVVVPYVSQMQPLYQYDYSQMKNQNAFPGFGYMNPQPEMQANSYENTDERESSAMPAKIFAFIFALLSIAVIVLGRFIDIKYLYFAGNVSGINILIALPEVLKNGALMNNLSTIAFAGAALFALLIFIFGIIGVKRESHVFLIILCVLKLICCIACVVFMMQAQTAIELGKEVSIIEGIKNFSVLGKLQYGIYILTGLSLITLITLSIGQAVIDRE